MPRGAATHGGICSVPTDHNGLLLELHVGSGSMPSDSEHRIVGPDYETSVSLCVCSGAISVLGSVPRVSYLQRHWAGHPAGDQYGVFHRLGVPWPGAE